MVQRIGFLLFLIQLWTSTLGFKWTEKQENFNVFYKEKWEVDLDIIEDKPQIYRVWPIPNTNEVNIYGKYNHMTILGNKHNVRLYQLNPFSDSHSWYKEGLYFIASDMLCKYSYSEANNIEWNKLEEGILNFKISNSYNSSYFHMSIKTISSGYFCTFPSFDCMFNPFYRSNSTSSVVSLSIDRYLILGFDQPLCFLHADHSTKKLEKYWKLDDLGEGKVVKSGGIYDNNRDIIHVIEQIDRVYLIQLGFNLDFYTKSIYRMKDDFGYWLFTGFIEVRDSRLYTLIKWITTSIIIAQRNQETPIAFYTDSLNDCYAGISQNRFFLFTVSDNRLSFNIFNAPLTSIHSIESFELLDYCPMNKIPSSLYSTDLYYVNSSSLHFSKIQINELRNITVKSKNLTDYSNINFNSDDWHITKAFYNSKNIKLNDTNCKFICSSDSEDFKYSVDYLKDRKTNSIQLDSSTTPKNLTNIPIVLFKGNPEDHVFIVKTSFRNKTFQSLITLTVQQWMDYCQECRILNSCITWMYGTPPGLFSKCPSKNSFNLKTFNIMIALFIILLLILSLSSIIPWHSYIEAWNHYHSLMYIFMFSYINNSSSTYIYTILLAISPYFSPLMIVNLINENFTDRTNFKRMYDIVIVFKFKPSISLELLSYFYMWIAIIYFLFIIIRPCTKRLFIRFSKIILDNSTFYYSMINFLLLAAIIYWREYVYLFYDFNSISYSWVFLFVLLVAISTINYSSYIEFKYSMKAYTMKLFNVNNTEIKRLNCLFIGLQNTPLALLYNILNCSKRFLTFLLLTLRFMWATSLVENDWSDVIALIFLLSIIFIEWCWLSYLIKVYPYNSFSANRILIANQMMVITLGTLSSLSIAFTIFTDDANNNFLDTIDEISAFWLLPVSYILFLIHYIFIKVCYKKKKNIMYPKFWKIKNPNRHFASQNSFTEYMAYNPYGEY